MSAEICVIKRIDDILIIYYYIRLFYYNVVTRPVQNSYANKP